MKRIVIPVFLLFVLVLFGCNKPVPVDPNSPEALKREITLWVNTFSASSNDVIDAGGVTISVSHPTGAGYNVFFVDAGGTKTSEFSWRYTDTFFTDTGISVNIELNSKQGVTTKDYSANLTTYYLGQQLCYEYSGATSRTAHLYCYISK